MAMYVFQELAPKIFYFTYCLQEIGNYIKFIEETETSEFEDQGLIGRWSKEEWGYEKRFSSDFGDRSRPIDPRNLFLINNLKATFHHCFSQYKIFNNIEEDVNLDSTYFIRKFDEGQTHNNCGSHGKYTARLYINDSFEGGEVTIHPGKPSFKPEAGSIIIAPSLFQIEDSPAKNNSRYVAKGHWI